MTTTYPASVASNSKKPIWPLDEGDPLLDYVRSVLGKKPCGLCTDIDGTISETAPTVDAAVLLPGMRELLEELTHQFALVATISGRGVEDQRRMIGVPRVWHVGHHGYEWEEMDTTTGEREVLLWSEAEPFLEAVAAALNEIEAELAPKVPGLWMERKGITGGIHWRLAHDSSHAEWIARPIIERIAAKYGLRQRGGKLAVELLPPVVTDKGQGLRRLIDRHHVRGVLYLGDDISDADAFKQLRSMRESNVCSGVSIGVVHRDTPQIVNEAADLLVWGTLGVRQFLADLRDLSV